MPVSGFGGGFWAAMKAAAHPAHVDYLYYVRKPDHRHHFFTASASAFDVPYSVVIQVTIASRASPIASLRSALNPKVTRPAGVSACTEVSGGAPTRSNCACASRHGKPRHE